MKIPFILAGGMAWPCAIAGCVFGAWAGTEFASGHPAGSPALPTGRAKPAALQHPTDAKLTTGGRKPCPVVPISAGTSLPRPGRRACRPLWCAVPTAWGSSLLVKLL